MTEFNLTSHLVGFIVMVSGFILTFKLLMMQIHRLQDQKKRLEQELSSSNEALERVLTVLVSAGGGLLKRRFDNLQVANTLIACVPEFLGSDTSEAMQVRCDLSANEQLFEALYHVPVLHARLEPSEHLNDKAPEVKQQRAHFWNVLGRHVPLPHQVL